MKQEKVQRFQKSAQDGIYDITVLGYLDSANVSPFTDSSIKFAQNVNDFKPSKSQRRVISKNNCIKRLEKDPEATDEQFSVFKAYLTTRHLNGGMSEMDALEFSAMIEETNVHTTVFEYRINKSIFFSWLF